MNPPRGERDFPVGPAVLAAGCDVSPNTPSIWLARGVLPAPDLPELKAEAVWWASTIALWAAATGRTWSWERAWVAASQVANWRMRKEYSPAVENGQQALEWLALPERSAAA